MSLKYNCEWCDFHTNLKGDFSRHLKTNKHKESTKSQHLVNQKSTFLKINHRINFSVNIASKTSSLNSQCTSISSILVKKIKTKICLN